MSRIWIYENSKLWENEGLWNIQCFLLKITNNIVKMIATTKASSKTAIIMRAIYIVSDKHWSNTYETVPSEYEEESEKCVKYIDWNNWIAYCIRFQIWVYELQLN